MIPKKNRKASLLATAIMFAGMLAGTVTLVVSHKKQGTPGNEVSIPHKLQPALKSKARSIWSGLQFYFHTRQQIDALQQKDSLTWEDSITLKNIDHQLNQMIHD